jgi:hypothetical protein
LGHLRGVPLVLRYHEVATVLVLEARRDGDDRLDTYTRYIGPDSIRDRLRVLLSDLTQHGEHRGEAALGACGFVLVVVKVFAVLVDLVHTQWFVVS